jgi:hypothetical protein
LPEDLPRFQALASSNLVPWATLTPTALPDERHAAALGPRQHELAAPLLSDCRAISRNDVIENGERTHPRVPFSAPSRKTGGASTAHGLVAGASPVPTGEGAGRNTRGRVCSPK